MVVQVEYRTVTGSRLFVVALFVCLQRAHVSQIRPACAIRPLRCSLLYALPCASARAPVPKQRRRQRTVLVLHTHKHKTADRRAHLLIPQQHQYNNCKRCLIDNNRQSINKAPIPPSPLSLCLPLPARPPTSQPAARQVSKPPRR